MNVKHSWKLFYVTPPDFENLQLQPYGPLVPITFK